MRYGFLLFIVVFLLNGCLSDSNESKTENPVYEETEQTTPIAQEPEIQPFSEDFTVVVGETADELIIRLNQLIADTDAFALDESAVAQSITDVPKLHEDIYRARRRLLGVSRLMSRVCIIIFLMLMCAASLAQEQTVAVGALEGAFSEDRFGGANYRIPITVPPGPGGLKPDIKLLYNSQTRSGMAGVGWQLEGLSSLHRCMHIPFLHGKRGRIEFSEQDALCLDGSFLEEIQPGEYRTRLESFTQVLRRQGHRASFFETHTQAGTIIRYGSTRNTRLSGTDNSKIFSWLIDTMEDSFGNQIKFQYTGTANEKYLSQIDYGSNRIVFEYEPRAYPSVAYLAGISLPVTKRLYHIVTYTGDERVYEYHLSYEDVALAKTDQLTEIKICSHDGTCLDPTQFRWSHDSNLEFGEITAFVQGNQDDSNRYQIGDFNGDGFSDIYYAGMFAADDDAVYLGDKDANLVKITGSHISGGSKEDLSNLRVGDFNGDGLSDIYHFRYRYNRDVIYLASQIDGKLTFKVIDGIDSGRAGAPTTNYHCVHVSCLKFGDFDGDGKLDIYRVRHQKSQPTVDDVYLSNGDGSYRYRPGVKSYANRFANLTKEDLLLLKIGDFNGDGVSDLYQVNHHAKDNIFLTLEEHYQQLDGIDSRLGNNRDKVAESLRLNLGDFNGDGLTDLFYVPLKYGSNPSNYVYLSTGDGRYKQLRAPAPFTHFSDLRKKIERLRLVDINSDGNTDIYYLDNQNRNDQVWLFLGDGKWLHQKIVGIETTTGGIGSEVLDDINRSRFADFNGDGLLDKVRLLKKSQGLAKIHLNRSPVPLIEKVIDGLGFELGIEYHALPTVHHSFFKGESTNQEQSLQAHIISGEHSVPPPLWVMTRLLQDGTTVAEFKYYNSRSNVRGLGFMGFTDIEKTDILQGVSEHIRYYVEFPHLGAVASQTQWHIDDNDTKSMLFTKTMQYEIASPPHGRTQFSRLTESLQITYEIDGQQVAKTRMSVSDYDDFGNAGLTVRFINDGERHFEQRTEKVFSNQLDQWLLGRLHQQIITDSDGIHADIIRTTVFEYSDEHPQPIKKIVEPGHPLSITYDYRYDEFGNQIETIAKPKNHVNSLRHQQTHYDAQGIFPVASIDALGHHRVYEYDRRFGLPSLLVDANGQEIVRTYDGWGRLLQESRFNGSIKHWAYQRITPLQALANEISGNGVYFVEEAANTGFIRRVYYDHRRRAIHEEKSDEGGGFVIQENRYDLLNRLVKTSLPYKEGLALDHRIWSSRYYDVRDRIVAESTPFPGRNVEFSISYEGKTERRSNAMGNEQRLVRDGLGRVVQIIGPLGEQVVFEYDALGRLLQITDAGGAETVMEYDVFGNRLSQRDIHSGQQSFQYDAFGQRLLSIDAEGRQTRWFYDALGRLIKRKNDDGIAEWTYDVATNGIGQLAKETFTGHSRRFYYDRHSRISRVEDQRGYVTSSTYDDYGRLAEVRYPGGFSVRRTYGRDNRLSALFGRIPVTSLLVEAETEAIYTIKAEEYERRAAYYRNLAESNSAELVAEFKASAAELDEGAAQLRAMEKNDETVVSQQCSANSASKLDRADDLLSDVDIEKPGHRLQQSLARQFVIEANLFLDCLEDGHQTRSSKEVREVQLWRANTRDAFGHVVAETIGNGWHTHTVYDSLRRPVEIIAKTAAGQETRHLVYYYDEVGNIVERQDRIQNVEEYFDYDEANRLVSASVIGPDDELHNQMFFYTYADNGNLTFKSGRGSISYQKGEQSHQLDQVGDDRYQYSATGNLVQGPDFSVRWNVSGKPLRIQAVGSENGPWVGYQYDANGIRIEQTSDSGQIHYAGDLYQERDTNKGKEFCSKVYAERRIVAVYCMRHGSGQVYYFHHDVIGSVDTISNEAGDSIGHFDYKPFGARRRLEGEHLLDIGYTGHDQLDLFGLIHMRGRMYDTRLGRFLSADPYIPAPLATQSYNRYGYVMNNPLGYNDPSGFFFKRVLKKISRTFKSIVSYVKNNPRLIIASAIGYYSGSWASGSLVKSASSKLVWSPAAMANGSYMAAYKQILATGNILSGAVGGGVASLLAGGNVRSIVANTVGGGTLCAIGSCYGRSAPTPGRVLASAAVNGVTAVAAGGSFKNAALTGLKGGVIRYAALRMRQLMIAQSMLNPDNASGLSAGLYGDRFKLGGGRYELGGAPSPLGGVQGGQGMLFGREYAAGSWHDLLVESFAGSHDFFNSWYWYDHAGNIRQNMSIMQRWIGEGLNAANVVLAAPFSAAVMVPDYFYSLPH